MAAPVVVGCKDGGRYFNIVHRSSYNIRGGDGDGKGGGGGGGAPPPMAMPLAQIPILCLENKRRRYTVKTTVAPATEIDKALEIDKQPTSGYEPQPKTQPANLLGVDEQPCSEPGSEPQLNAPFLDISDAYDDFLDMCFP